MLTAISLLVLIQLQPQLQPYDRVWETGKEDLKEISIPRGIVNGYRTLQWIYVVNEPLPNVVGRVKAKLSFKDRAGEIDASALMRRGFAFAMRDVGIVTQKISLTKGTYKIKRRVTGDTNTITTTDAGSTVITVTESVAPGKAPAKDWPAPTQKKFTRPALPASLLSLYKGEPHSWIGYLTQNANRSQFLYVYRDSREFSVVLQGLDSALVAISQWTKSDPPPTARYTPPTTDTGIDYVAVAPSGQTFASACSISVFWVADSVKLGWEMPGYEYLYRKIE